MLDLYNYEQLKHSYKLPLWVVSESLEVVYPVHNFWRLKNFMR